MAKQKLTNEEKQIIKFKAYGHKDREIAEIINISLPMYRYRYAQLLIKMDALNAPNLIFQAFQKGILQA